MAPATAAPQACVVLLHGIYMGAWAMGPLARRLRGCGFATRCFGYPSLRAAPADNAARLARWLEGVDHPTVHFVAHSLGGLVLRHLFATWRDPRPGRVVTLGTPHAGSAVARVLAARGATRWLLGRSLAQGLDGALPPWPAARPLAVLAGSLPVGLGRALARLPGPHDGTVTVAETEVAGAAVHRVVPASHFGLLVSAQAARLVCAFLREGVLPGAPVGGHGPR